MNSRRAANRSGGPVQSGDEYDRGKPRTYGGEPQGKAVPFGSYGPGPVAGAGEMPRKGPGRAAMRTRADSNASEHRPTPNSSTPGGIDRYKKGNPPPRGYHQ